MQLRVSTYRQTVDQVPLLELAVRYTGTWKQCAAYAHREGYEFRSDKEILFGGYYYRNSDQTVLYPT